MNELYFNDDYCNDFDGIPLPLLYRDVLPCTSMNDSEINNWGGGLDETCHTNHSVFFIKYKENDQADISDTDDIGEKSVDRFNDVL